MYKSIFCFIFFCASRLAIYGQPIGLSFQEAEKRGISISILDSIYKSAVHTDSLLSVFTTEKDQLAMHQAYVQLLRDLGQFLASEKFVWEKPTRCFNRIYFSADGSIDYFLFNFLGSEKEKPSESIQMEFLSLLNRFILNYTLPISAPVKFAQCSPTTFMPQK